jgi:hypothetical protein
VTRVGRRLRDHKRHPDKNSTARLSLGYPPAGVQGGVGAESETEKTTTSPLIFRESGAHTQRTIWTLKESSRDRKDILLNFIAVVIAAVQGEVEVDIELRAKLGVSVDTGLAVRKIITREIVLFDGKTLLGMLPTTLDVRESWFCATASRKLMIRENALGGAQYSFSQPLSNRVP